jgi:hypothetical protein
MDVRKHGTFRPKLLQLVQSNPEDVIQSTTKEAFSKLTSGKPPMAPLKKLVELKGIGPATASLLLSVYDPDSTPFFSDEYVCILPPSSQAANVPSRLFRWAMWDEPGGGGWKRGIKYNAKEYEQLVENVRELVKRLGVKAVDVEKVAWVLGKEAIDIGKEGKAEEEDAGKVEPKAKGEEVKKEVKAKKEVAPKKGTKRKIEDAKMPNEGTRRSSRKKT